ncbi:MAG: hypothetical protein OEY88_07780 [Candidatus Bathyarchaeota archaeon]|nr:hypothetical protein [Candidatus Bathyarchaeota archaeon]
MSFTEEKKKRFLREIRSWKVSPKLFSRLSNVIDSKEVQIAYSKIEPLVKNIITRKEVQSAISEVATNIERSNRYSDEIVDIIMSKEVTPKQMSILGLMCYLTLSEGCFSEAIQLISSILIENHHDLYHTERMRFVRSYKELDKVSLFVKLQFVELHGFKFVTNAYNRKLRNCIAHLTYTVEDDGTILNNRTGTKIENLWDKILKLQNMMIMLAIVFVDFRIDLEEQTEPSFKQEP